MPATSAPPRSAAPPRRSRCSIPPASRTPPPPPRTNRHLYDEANPLDLIPFAKEGRAVSGDRRRGARARSAHRAGVGEPCRQLDGDRDRPRRRLRRDATSARWFGSTSRSWSKRTAAARPASSASADAICTTICSKPRTGTARSTRRWPRRWSISSACRAPAGEMTVLLGPGWPGVLLHEAVGHGLEGDFNRKGTSAFSGRIGERVAAPGRHGGRRWRDQRSAAAAAARSPSTTRARRPAKPC